MIDAMSAQRRPLQDPLGLQGQLLKALAAGPAGFGALARRDRGRLSPLPGRPRPDPAHLLAPAALRGLPDPPRLSDRLVPELPHPDQRRRHPRYRRECNGPFGPQGRIIGTRNCRQQLARLSSQPAGNEKLLRIQQDLLARLRRPRDGPIEPTKAFWDLYELLFRLAIYFGTPEMLPTGTDAYLWWTFHEFCHLRDQLALTAGPTARERCGDLLHYQPGPLLSAAAMLIIDELNFTGSMLDALRYFMNQRRYDPWAGTLCTNTATTTTPPPSPTGSSTTPRSETSTRQLKPLPLGTRPASPPALT
ncbi:hypothetical protein [Nonomuraea sp. NPDC049400]|uniref:hypothetical protein n=1 Tax=Nonomuraea sp. NPDC049400 TaxID=3364352 RepID=UPI00379CF2BD